VISRRALRSRCAALAVAAALPLGGCAAPPADDAWLLQPIRYDNRMDGAGLAQPTELPYPMRLAADTAGGLWGESAGSWLHLDAEGRTLRRFNLEPGVAHVTGFAAVSPTRLVVTTADGAGGPGAVRLFDTEAMSWTLLQPEAGPLGDIAAHGGAISYVAYAPDATSFTIKRLVRDSGADATVVSPELAGASADASGAALAAGPDGTLYVATSAERIVMSPAGEVVERVALRAANPRVAVSASGAVLWSAPPRPGSRPRIAVLDASPEAGSIIESLVDCDEDALTLGAEVLPLCAVQGVAWFDDGTLVVSAGDEGGAPLIRVTPPRLGDASRT